MIKARHQPFHTWFFRIYTLQMIRWHFSQVSIRGEFYDRGVPVLLIGNHFGWWDGFIANLLNVKVFKRRFHVMMLEEQLQNRMFLNKAGAYSINPGSRSVVESLEYTADLLKDPKNLATLYPQGEFQSMHNQNFRFQPGIIKVLTRLKSPVHIVFYVALVDYFAKRKPSLTIYFSDYEMSDVTGIQALEKAYNELYNKAGMQQKPE